MESLAIALLIPFIKKLIDFIRYFRAALAKQDSWNGVVTQLIVWLAAIGGVMLAAQTDWAENFAFNEDSLATVNLVSQIFIGLLLGSSASLVQDTLKSIDNRNTSAIPTLMPARNAELAPVNNTTAGSPSTPTVG